MAALLQQPCHFIKPDQVISSSTHQIIPSSTNYSSSSLFPSKPTKFTKIALKSSPARLPTQICNAHVSTDPDPAPAQRDRPLKIAIVGFGNFGQFIAKAIRRQGHHVLATSRSDYSDYCDRHGIRFYRNVDEMCDERPDVVLVCSSILSTETVLRGIPMHKLNPDTIFADVLSVKQFPRNLLLEVLPPGFGIVCTHPMFGPESGKNGWSGLPFVYDKVRIAENTLQARKCEQFLSAFEQEGCRMVEMSCEEHDRHAAGSQFITHTIGRILSHLDLESTPINTKGYETLLQLTENTVSDSFDLYYGLFMYNVNATEQIENLDRAFEAVKQKLFGRLHDLLRKQIVERVPLQGAPQVAPVRTKHADVAPSYVPNIEKASKANAAPSFLPDSGKMKALTSFAMPPPPQDSNNDGSASQSKEESRKANRDTLWSQ
ncbi:hypothetical protein Scep_011611 [Stephania cephalantha]|uniref:Prephenate/arogenate dehydrogenase domain-containing protein n=1 Tax=Stephania cephalantha TaxID=152367 RepID=A0AAP0P609_9MAGN